jgi:hypothetical protein
MEDEYRIHRALLEEMEKENSNSLEEGKVDEGANGSLGIDQLSIRGRSPERKESDVTRSSSSTSPRKASVDVDKLLKNLPQKSERSKSSESKPPVRIELLNYRTHAWLTILSLLILKIRDCVKNGWIICLWSYITI